MATRTRTHGKADDQRKEVVQEFKRLVNMTPGQIEKFLDTTDSKRVGFKQGGVGGTGESVGHKSGRRIIQIKQKKQGELTDDDVKHMKKVVGYINRHCKQGPTKKNDVKESRWRYSLMNWGHDPMKGGSCGRS